MSEWRAIILSTSSMYDLVLTQNGEMWQDPSKSEYNLRVIVILDIDNPFNISSQINGTFGLEGSHDSRISLFGREWVLYDEQLQLLSLYSSNITIRFKIQIRTLIMCWRVKFCRKILSNSINEFFSAQVELPQHLWSMNQNSKIFRHLS